MHKHVLDKFYSFQEGKINRRQFLTGISGSAAATLFPQFATRSAHAQYAHQPYTLKERDRRWALVRAFMSEKRLPV